MDLESKFKITFLKAEGSTKNTSPRVRNIKKNRFDMTLPQPRHTYLSSSAMACDLSTVRLLIARRVSLQSDADGCDITALMIAAGQGSTEIVRLLLDSGASVNASSRARWTALHYAAASGNNHIVRILCERGASVYCKDFGGRTPLSVAPEYMPPGESYRPLQTLLRANADVDACDDEGLTPLHKILRKEPLNTVALEQFVRAGANTRLMMHDATGVLKLLMSTTEPRPVLTAIGRGLNHGITFLEIVCDRLNHVRDAYEDLNDREHMLIYLSAQAGYEDVAFLLSLGCDVQVVDSNGFTALHSAVEDDDLVAIEALVLAGASLDAHTGDEASEPLDTEVTANDEAEIVRTSSRTESPRSATPAASTNLTAATEPQQCAATEIGGANLAGGSDTNESRTPFPSDSLFADSIIADSFVAESLFAESLVAESMIAESLAAQSFYAESLATPSTTESNPPHQPRRPRTRQPPRTTSSAPPEATGSSDREVRPSPTRGWTRPARREKKNRLFGGSS
jgi:ankyrin repeat protein